MLFAISGSQGSGKSTVIATLKERGFPVVERKTSRSILEEWNVTLSQVNNDRELTVRFQDEILQRKIDDDSQVDEDPSRIVFTERTLADFFTYALVAIGKDNEYSDWVDDYFDRCVKAQSIYNHNFYLAQLNATEHDGVRGSNKHYTNMVDVVMRDVLSRMHHASYVSSEDEYKGPGTTNITMRDNEARVDEILRAISRYI
jgi:predicted ATPase